MVRGMRIRLWCFELDSSSVGGAIVEQADRPARHHLGPAGQLAEQPSRRRQPQAAAATVAGEGLVWLA